MLSRSIGGDRLAFPGWLGLAMTQWFSFMRPLRPQCVCVCQLGGCGLGREGGGNGEPEQGPCLFSPGAQPGESALTVIVACHFLPSFLSARLASRSPWHSRAARFPFIRCLSRCPPPRPPSPVEGLNLLAAASPLFPPTWPVSIVPLRKSMAPCPLGPKKLQDFPGGALLSRASELNQSALLLYKVKCV